MSDKGADNKGCRTSKWRLEPGRKKMIDAIMMVRYNQMRIGRVSRFTGISARTLRRYVKCSRNPDDSDFFLQETSQQVKLSCSTASACAGHANVRKSPCDAPTDDVSEKSNDTADIEDFENIFCGTTKDLESWMDNVWDLQSPKSSSTVSEV